MKVRSLPMSLILLGLLCSSFSVAQESKKEKAKIEFYFVESEFIEGVTGKKKYQLGESDRRNGYLHLKPALVLTPSAVDDYEMDSREFSTSIGDRDYYFVNLTLTEHARKKLASKVKGKGMKMLTVLVDGKRMNLYRYEVDENKKGVPKKSLAKNFSPMIGFFAKEKEAQRIVDAIEYD